MAKNESKNTDVEVTKDTDLGEEQVKRNIADTEIVTDGEPIVDIHEAAEERVKKNKEQIERNEELAKILETEQEKHEEMVKRFNDNIL